MSKIIINENCTICGLCTKVCTGKTLEIVNGKIVQTSPELCCMCGHCAAICKQNAIGAGTNTKKSFETLEILDSQTQIEKLLLNKRSVREFTEKNIEKDILEKMIFYAEKAPSSANFRNREYVVITDKKVILEMEKAVVSKFLALKFIVNKFTIGIIKLFSKKLSSELKMAYDDIIKMKMKFEKKDFPIFRNAPCVVLFTAPKSGFQSKDDCVIAQQYMMLFAESIGIGSCVIGYAYFAKKKLIKLLKINKKNNVYAVSIFGYKKYNYSKGISHKLKNEAVFI